VMYLGQMMEVADRDTLFAAPRHPYTEILLAAVPVPTPASSRSARCCRATRRARRIRRRGAASIPVVRSRSRSAARSGRRSRRATRRAARNGSLATFDEPRLPSPRPSPAQREREERQHEHLDYLRPLIRRRHRHRRHQGAALRRRRRHHRRPHRRRRRPRRRERDAHDRRGRLWSSRPASSTRTPTTTRRCSRTRAWTSRSRRA
jgi:hypothetical protein